MQDISINYNYEYVHNSCNKNFRCQCYNIKWKHFSLKCPIKSNSFAVTLKSCYKRESNSTLALPRAFWLRSFTGKWVHMQPPPPSWRELRDKCLLLINKILFKEQQLSLSSGDCPLFWIHGDRGTCSPDSPSHCMCLWFSVSCSGCLYITPAQTLNCTLLGA